MELRIGARHLAIVIGLVVAGCSEDGPPPIDDPAAYLALVPQLDCDFLVRCGLLETPEQCAPYQATTPPYIEPRAYDRRHLAALERGTVSYSPDSAGRCAAWLRDRSCWFREFPPRECWQVFTGRVPIGGAVRWAFECETEWVPYNGCDEKRECCQLVCSQPSGGIPIDPDRCGPDATGRNSCPQGKVCTGTWCVAGPESGGECHSDNECPDDHLCHEWRCTNVARIADRCIAPPSVYRGSCVDVASICHADGVCRRLPFTGEACDRERFFSCAPGLRCDRSTSRCVGFGGIGTTCRDALCESGLFCDFLTDTCQPLRADGDACLSDDHCTSGHCTSTTQTCGPPLVCP